MRFARSTRIELLETFGASAAEIRTNHVSKKVGGINLSYLETNFGYIAKKPFAYDFEETICLTFLDAGSVVSMQNGRTEQLDAKNVLIYSNTQEADWHFA